MPLPEGHTEGAMHFSILIYDEPNAAASVAAWRDICV
jgi:hypothetical protein